MNTNPNLTRWSWLQLDKRLPARTGMLLWLLLLTPPGAAQAQFQFTTNNAAITITKYTGSGGVVIIPSTTNGLPVTAIGEKAFYGRPTVTGVVIPDSITVIGAKAFQNCTGLTSAPLPGNLTSLPTAVFDHCTSLTSQAIPGSVMTIGEYAFYACSSLASVTIANGVGSIQQTAFGQCASLASITIPASVTSIEINVFAGCSGLTAITVLPANSAYSSLDGVLFNKTRTTLIQYPAGKTRDYTVPDTVTDIAYEAFAGFSHLFDVTIPDNVTSIRGGAFMGCGSLSSVTIGRGVTTIEDFAFAMCSALSAVYFQGNAPIAGRQVFADDFIATGYYLPGTAGWSSWFSGLTMVLWDPPVIQTPPRTQTAEVGSKVAMEVQVSGGMPLICKWYFNGNSLISSGTDRELQLTNVQLSDSGTYTVVVANPSLTVTSAPAVLEVIPVVERRTVPRIKLMGDDGSLLTVDYANALSSAPSWLPLDTVSLVSTSQYYFDVSEALPPQRFYRAWQTGAPSVIPSLSLPGRVPAITLTGTIGDSVRVDAINQFGPIDAWVTLDTVTLTNTSQLYFDTCAWGQPERLYRLVPVP